MWKKISCLLLVLILAFMVGCSSQTQAGNALVTPTPKPLTHDEAVQLIEEDLNKKDYAAALFAYIGSAGLLTEDVELISKVHYEYALNSSITSEDKIKKLLKVSKDSSVYNNAENLAKVEVKKCISKAAKDYKESKKAKSDVMKSNAAKINLLESAIGNLNTALLWSKDNKSYITLKKQYAAEKKTLENKLALQKKTVEAKAAKKEKEEAAKAAKEEKAAAAKAAKAEKAEDSYKMVSDDGGLALLSYSSSNGYVNGKIKNIGHNDYSYVQVNITISDKDGNIIDDAIDNISGLAVGKTWKFHAGVLVDGRFWYQIDSIEYYY